MRVRRLRHVGVAPQRGEISPFGSCECQRMPVRLPNSETVAPSRLPSTTANRAAVREAAVWRGLSRKSGWVIARVENTTLGMSHSVSARQVISRHTITESRSGLGGSWPSSQDTRAARTSGRPTLSGPATRR
jgi:hypothetical protein